MIYFDNAATTFPKPSGVSAAVRKAMSDYGGNPGRAGHKLAMKTAEAVFDARAKAADFFGAEVEHTTFTLNCTHALNIAVKGVAARDSQPHYIISDAEHNAVARPVHAVCKERGSYSIARTYDDDSQTVKSFESLFNARTKAVICTAASNVSGKILPYARIAALCKSRGVCFVLDAAQGGGVLPIKVGGGVNFVCCSGHKSLYGPMGTGLLISDGSYSLAPLTEGGTGGNSMGLEQPDTLPDRHESGTPNTPGAIALGAGIDFVCKLGTERIFAHERELCELFLREVSAIPKVERYFDNLENRTPLVPFNIAGMDSSRAADLLSDAGFALRGGLHCAFLAHKKLGTLECGVVRFAPSVFNTRREVTALVRAIKRIAASV
jgi:cysteine desulfurase family protein